MAFKLFKTHSELLQLAESLNMNELRLLDLNIELSFCSKIKSPSAQLEAYTDRWPRPKALMTILKQTFTRPFVSFYLLNDGELKDMDDFFRQTRHLLFDFDEFMIFHTDYTISCYLCPALSDDFDVTAHQLPCHAFYIPEEAQMELARYAISLPSGFDFCEIDPDKDCELVSSTWEHASSTDLLNTKSKLSHYPSTGIKYAEKLVAFEMTHHTGALNHLFTSPEFRAKGLGTAVELRLAKRIIEMGITPFKCVAIENTVAMLMVEKSKFWKKIYTDDTNEPLILDNHLITRKH